MISSAGWLNPTRIIGLASCLFALASCVIALAKGSGPPRRKRLAAILAGLEGALLIDMVFDIRWMLHDFEDRVAMENGVYGLRSGPQMAMLVLLIGIVLGALGLAIWRFRGRTYASLAACGGILSVSCWFAEVVSLHAVDAVAYHRIHGAMLVSLAWIACSLMTGVGILCDAFAFRAYPRVTRRRA
jgi:uncharacterized iron-regulated membrane protein